VIGKFTTKDPTDDQAEKEKTTRRGRLSDQLEVGRPIRGSDKQVGLGADQTELAGKLRIFVNEDQKSARQRQKKEAQPGQQRQARAQGFSAFDPNHAGQPAHFPASIHPNQAQKVALEIFLLDHQAPRRGASVNQQRSDRLGMVKGIWVGDLQGAIRKELGRVAGSG